MKSNMMFMRAALLLVLMVTVSGCGALRLGYSAANIAEALGDIVGKSNAEEMPVEKDNSATGEHP